MKKKAFRGCLAVLLALLMILFPLVVFAGGKKAEVGEEESVSGAMKSKGRVKTPKYVFLFIGDGMGLPQINAAEIYLGAIGGERIELKKLNLSRLPAQGLATTYSADSFITDSAAAATAIATGYKTDSGVISMDPTKTKNYKTIAEMAKERGMKVGIVSSVSIDHATPACFYAHTPSRGNYYEIGIALAQSDFDFFGGGGMKSPRGKDGKEPDALEMARQNGFTIADTKERFEALKLGAGKVLAYNSVLDRSKAMNYEIDRPKDEISLEDYTRKAVELLDNERGFFLMVEGGKIDWACHANDATAAINDVLAFDKAVGVGLDFYDRHPEETLIVVTGDHGCGGMTIGFAGTKYSSFFEKIVDQKVSYDAFNSQILNPYKEAHSAQTARFTDLVQDVEEYFGLIVLSEKERAELQEKADSGDAGAAQRLGMALTEYELKTLKAAFMRSVAGETERAADEETYLMYGGYEPFTVTLTHVLNHKAGIAWTTYSHTGTPVPTFSIGVGHEEFNGYYDNTDIQKKMAAIMKFSRVVASAQ